MSHLLPNLLRNRFLKAAAALLVMLGGSQIASAALYEANPANFGAVQASSSNCDDCFDGPIAFTGAGQSINFFGTAYTNLFVGSNGFVTFGTGSSVFTSQPLDTQTIAPMIAGIFADLDTRLDVASQVFVNTATPGQIIVTWANVGSFNANYTNRKTFQLVVRSDQFATPAGQGQIGFFYDVQTDPNLATAGFGDGLAAVNPGEVGVPLGPITGLSNTERWYTLSGGVPATPTPTSAAAIPTLSEWALIVMALVLAGVAMRSGALSQRRH